MPRIPQKNLNSCVFIYPTKDDAKEGNPVGGCGFVVSMQCETNPKFMHRYVVTNHHVVSDGSPAIRFNTVDGGIDIVETHHGDWILPKSQVDDLAIWCLPHYPNHDCGSMPIDMIADEKIIREYSLGIGDKVFSLGRFLDVDRKQRNYPVARFGVVACMPEIPLSNSSGVQMGSYLVEMRSRTGFSGSPVYIYIPPLDNLWDEERTKLHVEAIKDVQKGTFNRPWLLGVHFCELPVTGPEAFQAESDRTTAYQYGSGMSGVIPACKLKEFLMNNEELITHRKEIETQAGEQS